ncbi:MAG: hypothetical protein HYR55_13650 [Acidobacteria bacterium]|nr:hypothetical protein [Acidobacteriota bacterium]MBI3658248.1 hypothetical protein [Acidobacteriota bacterium]
MLTLFTCPKPFKGHIEIIQRNAIVSWTRLRPAPQIVLLGDEAGAAEVCRSLGLRHVPDIACNEFGTPLLNDVFEQAHQCAFHKLMAFVNTDIILMSDFMAAVEHVSQAMRRFLLLGQRWDVDIQEPVDFETEKWEIRLREYAERTRPPGPLWGLADYFVFPKGALGELPPFTVGRTAWDNWLIYRARALRLPVIDATPRVMVIHQKHDYTHQSKQPQGWNDSSLGIESRRNQTLSGGEAYNQFGLADATHLLTLTALRRALGWRYLLRHMEAAPILFPWLRSLLWVIRLKKFSARAIAKIGRVTRAWGRAVSPNRIR